MSEIQTRPLRRKQLLGISELDESEIHYLFQVARKMSPAVERGETLPLLKGRTVVNFFFEDSTRTRTAFEVSARKLQAATLNFASRNSSQSKGETLIDTAKIIEAMSPHCLVVRHPSAGSPAFLASRVNLPIVNAGDGFHEHPTQALLDGFTIQEKLGSIRGKRVVIIGDIAHSRVARSNIHLLKKLGASVAISGPPTLLPPKPETLGVECAYRPERLIREADVVMTLRIQLERQNRQQIPSLGEYQRFWGINKDRADSMKDGAIILHPGPVNRGVELAPEVADGPRSVILSQVRNGVATRMAVLAAVCNPKGLEEWLKTQS